MNNDIDPPFDPWSLFTGWYAEAQKVEKPYPDAMTLATVGAEGMPSARTVLMKSFDASGIVFHTNRDSRKGIQLKTHAKAALCFYWRTLERQVRIEGAVTPVSDAESDAYFRTRPRGSQIGAWASQQSRPLESRTMLEARVTEIEKKYASMEVPRPAYWGGYRLVPAYFEFWQERLFRLHDRIAYSRAEDGQVWADDRVTYRRESGAGGWNIERLYP